MKISIMGTRGVPAAHGGFETFAEFLALYLVDRGWDVTVYCQKDSGEDGFVEIDRWKGVNRVSIVVLREGAMGTILFDWRSILHASRSNPGVVLTLGYNTALFCLPYRFKGIRNLINMDGLEWKRDKWKWYERLWLWGNERAGCILGDHLIADHPEIANHLATRVSRRKIATIPYGANRVLAAPTEYLDAYGVSPGRYAVVIARPEPENSLYEIVESFSRRQRGYKLLVLGRYTPEVNDFHKKVMAAASAEVVFAGAIYDKVIVDSLRFHALAYVHGHRVGGTNPSLVEALGAGSAVMAHDNSFNKWVAGDAGAYFSDADQCAQLFDRLSDGTLDVEQLKKNSIRRFDSEFKWNDVLGRYEDLLRKWI